MSDQPEIRQGAEFGDFTEKSVEDNLENNPEAEIEREQKVRLIFRARIGRRVIVTTLPLRYFQV